jgi:cytochrome P450 family 110
VGPAWWQLIYWIADPIAFQDKCCQKYGDIFTMPLSRLGSLIMIGNPQAVREVFAQDSKFEMGRANSLAEPLVRGCFKSR